MEVYFDQQLIYPSMITSLYPNPFLMYPFIPFRHQQTDTKLILDEEIISDWLFEVLMSNLARWTRKASVICFEPHPTLGFNRGD